MTKKAELTVDRLVAETANIAFLDPQDCFDRNGNILPIQEWPESHRRALAGLDVKFRPDVCPECGKKINREIVKIKFWDKNQAISHGMRYHGAFKDRVTIDFDEQVEIHYKVLKKIATPQQLEEYKRLIAEEMARGGKG